MHEPNRQKLLDLLKQHPEWLVLDIGGGEQPLLRADYTLDIMPFNECGQQGCIGDLDDWENKRLSADSWITMDICGRRWPFTDKSIDFVVCSNVLEDVRDPVRVVREINRVGKQGYIEFPRVGQELSDGVDENNPDYGYWHHRWYICWDGRNLQFLPKLSIMGSPEAHSTPIKSSPCPGMMPRFNTVNKKGFESVYWKNYIGATEIMAGSPADYFDCLEGMLDV